MTALLIGVALLLLVLGGMRLLALADARLIARSLRRGGGVAALAGAVYFTATGRFPVPSLVTAVANASGLMSG